MSKKFEFETVLLLGLLFALLGFLPPEIAHSPVKVTPEHQIGIRHGGTSNALPVRSELRSVKAFGGSPLVEVERSLRVSTTTIVAREERDAVLIRPPPAA